MYGVIKVLIDTDWFSLEEYNRRLRTFQFKSYESADRPMELPLKNTKKMSGKACSQWVHVRNFPLIIRPFVRDSDDEVLILGLLLVELTARITASEFRESDIQVLEEKVIDYLDKRLSVAEQYPTLMGNVKPKHHLLTHYGQAIRMFGPPLSFWTARWESKHRVAKNIAESAKNFKNISLTVSHRQQLRMASVCYRGMFDTIDIVIPERATYKKDLKVQNMDENWQLVRDCMTLSDVVCEEVVAYQQKYKVDDVVVLDVRDYGEVLLVGVVKAIVVKKYHVIFLVKKYFAEKKYLNYFQANHQDGLCTLIDIQKLADPKPLIKHGTDVEFNFVLHHQLLTH